MSSGNGNGLAKSHTDLNLPDWLMKMRRAAVESISEEDVKQIVQAQVKAAKEGNRGAIKFVFDNLLGGNLQGTTFIQNNFSQGAAEVRPSDHPKGSSRRIDAMAARVASGHSPFDDAEIEPDLS
jgi:hypothetical protein